MPAPPPRDEDRLYGALLGLFAALGLGLALWARGQPLPELLPEQWIPARIAAVVLDRPDQPPAEPVAAPPGPGGRGAGGPPRPAVAPRPPGPQGLLDGMRFDPEGRLGAGPEDLGSIRAAFDESTRFEGGPVAAAGRLGAEEGRADGTVAGPELLGGGRVEVAALPATRKASVLAALAARALPPPPPPPPGALPAAVQTALLRRHRSSIGRCHAALQARHPRAAGRVVVEVALSPGAPPVVRITEDTVGDATFAQCIRLRVARWDFPAPAAPTRTRFPFAFDG